MKSRRVWLLIGLATWPASASGWGTDASFFRVGCLNGGAPQNIAIASDDSGQIFLGFDTVEGKTYSIEDTDSLCPPAWKVVSTLTGDGQRVAWLTARTWSKTFGGSDIDRAYSVRGTGDGGYIIAGMTRSFGAGRDDVYLIRTDAAGNEVWSRTFGGHLNDWAMSVQPTSDGGYVLAGGTNSFGLQSYGVYLIKTDANGDEAWSRTFGGTDIDGWRREEAMSVQQTSDGGYIVAGYTESLGEWYHDVYLVKTDANGDEIWSKTFGGPGGQDTAYCVQQTADGGYILAGYRYIFSPPSSDAILIKTDANGDKVWSRTFGGSDFDGAYSVQQTSDGGYIVAGDTWSFGAGLNDVYLIKTDANGDRAWSRTFGGPDRKEAAGSVQQTSDGGYIVAAQTTSIFDAVDVYLVKTDQNGNEVWSSTIGGDAQEYASSVQQTLDGGYILAGQISSFGDPQSDVYLIKTDANGNAPPPE